MKRIDAIKEIMNNLHAEEIVISSCGYISREVYHTKDRPENFYMMGSMGCCLPLAIGVALCKSNKEVIVIAGDGEILMSLGTLVLMKKLELKNLTLYILDNNSYASTSGQKTCSDAVDFKAITNCCVIKVYPEKGNAGRIKIKYEQLAKRFYNAINNKNEKGF